MEFDQPMGAGYSVVGGGSFFPKGMGACRWKDDHTFIVPVGLDPDHDYLMTFNEASFTNFRNAAGEPALSYPLTFATAPDPAARPRTRANTRAFVALKRAILDDYSHRDRLGVDWTARFHQFEKTLLAAPSPRSFARTAAKLLEPAQDPHLVVSRPFWGYLTYDARPEPNFNMGTLAAVVPAWREAPGGGVATGRFEDGVGYASIAGWDGSARAGLKALYGAIRDTTPTSGLVLDVRANAGGDESIAQLVAGCFVHAPTIYATIARVRDHGEWLGPFDRSVDPNPECPPFPADRVAVLQGPVNLSSNESFLMMMHAAGATLVGERSGGSSALPVRHPLGSGIAVMVPSWEDTWPDDTPIEGRGVSPTVSVETHFSDFLASDPVLDAALRVLRGP